MEIKTVRVSEKGQIAIPTSMRGKIGIEQGDELLLVETEGKILIEKAEKISQSMKDDFEDILNSQVINDNYDCVAIEGEKREADRPGFLFISVLGAVSDKSKALKLVDPRKEFGFYGPDTKYFNFNYNGNEIKLKYYYGACVPVGGLFGYFK